MSIYYHIKALIETIERFFFYGWKFRKSYDFDASYIYDMLYVKLSRIHDCMKYKGHCVWNDDESNNRMRKLCEAKGLAKKLMEEQYIKNYVKFREKYTHVRGNNFDKELYPDAKIIDDDLWSSMFKKSIKKDDMECEGDRKRFFYLLEKYVPFLWD